MTSYGSSTDRRSPTYGTATFSTFSNSQTPMSPSRYSHSSSDTPLASSDGEGATSDVHMRRVNVSPEGSRHSYDSYFEENSLEETAEVEAALNDIDREFESTEDMLTQWSRGSSSAGPTYTGTTPSYSTSLDTYSIYNRDGNRLSTISERTENIPSRPASHGARIVTEAHRLSAHRINTASPSPAHTRSQTDFVADRAPGRRTGDLIAFFEDRASTPSESSFGHTRTSSMPAYRSHSPFHPVGQSTPHMGTTTGYGTSTGYGSRPSSPAKSKAGSTLSSTSSASDSLSMSSLLAPPTRGNTTLTRTGTQLSPSDFASTFSNTFTASRTASNITSITPTSTLRRPQTSPRSPLTSVRNIVAAWKERTPSLTKSPQSPTESTTSPSSKAGQSGGLGRVLSLRRRAERRGPRAQNGQSGSGDANGNRHPTTPKSIASSIIPPPFDMTELGAYARDSREPLRIGVLWYLNVHSGPPYRWQRCEALLYPHMLVLSWIAPGGGRGVVTLDLLNCTEVRSVPSPTHSSAREDVGTIAVRAQVAEGHGSNLLELLCPFQLLYSDGVERLAAESARERVRWVSAIWEALDRSVTLPSRSEPGSPTGSIWTIRTIASQTSTSESASGSASTVFVPPLHSIPSLSDLSDNLSTGSPSHAPSYPTHHTRTTDDAAVSNQSYVYPGDPRVIAPSRSSSLRRVSSLTDLDAEFATAVSRARSARPGLGFGLSLVGGTILGDGSPVTVSSGPRLGGDVRVTPPPSSKTKPRPLSDFSDDAFFSAASKTSSDTRSSFYSLTSTTSTSDRDPTTSGIITDETALEFTSGGSNTEIVPSTLSYRRTESNSYLGDSHDGSFACSTCTPSSPSRSSLSRSAEIRRRRYTRCLTCSEDVSDKENTASGYTPSASRSTMSTWTRSCTATPTPVPSTAALSVLDLRDSSGSEGYETATSPSTASFKSLPTIPSETDYHTASVCKTDASSEFYTADVCKTEASTEFYTAEICRSEVSTEFVTAEKCKTETETEFVTADICESERSTQFETASVCKTIPSEASTPRSLAVDLPSERAPTPPIKAPSVVPSIVSESDVEPPVSPAAVPLPTSEFSPTLSSGSREVEPEPPAVTEVTHTEIVYADDLSITLPSTVSPTSPGESLRTGTISLTASSRLVVSELPPATESEPVFSDLSSSESDETLEQEPEPESERTPSIHPSQWALETDMSYDSTHLQPTPFSRSVSLHEDRDESYETSVMRPSPSPLTSPGDLTLISETISTSTPSLPPPPLPLPLPPVLAPTPAPISVPSTTPVPRQIMIVSSPSPSLSRTPSTVSSVSSLSSREDYDVVSLPDVPPASDISTEPSLLSTTVSTGTLYVHVDPVVVPLPPSPAPSISVSMATPSTNRPSIRTTLVTEAETEITRTETVTRDITRDIERILREIRELDHLRGEETHGVAENVRIIRDELRLLSEYVRNRLMTTERVVVTPAAAPTVVHRDRSVGGRSDISEPRVTPAGPRDRPHLIPVEMSPPLTRTPSITSSASGLSYLSSHHSDDDLLYGEHEAVEGEEYELPSSLAWSSSSPSSPSSDLTPSLVSSSEPSPGPTLSLTSSSLTPTPPPSSPTPSTSSSSTARPVESPSFSVLRDMLANLREQMNGLWEGQSSTHQMLDELRQSRPMPQDNAEVLERLDTIESLLQRVIERTESVNERRTTEAVRERETRRPRVESVSESSTDADSLYRRWSDLLHRPDHTRIHAPTPRHVGPSLDEQLLELLGAPPSQRPAGVQPPPPLIPFMYQPTQRPSRSRSASPDLERSTTAPPFTAPVIFSPETIHDRPLRRPHPRAQFRPPPRGHPPAERPEPPVVPVAQPPLTHTPQPMHTMGDAPAERVPHVQPAYPVVPPLHERPPTAPATLGGVDDPHASSSWYRRRPHRDAAGGVVPPPGDVFPPPPPGAQGPTYVPMPPGPTVVQLPLFDTLMGILREHRLAQLATVDQQRELMRYMRGLNEWLARDVNDRQSELRGVTARLDSLRAELARHGIGAGVIPAMPQPQVPVQPQQGFVIPPIPQAVAGPPPQPPFVTVNYPGVVPPVIPDHVRHVPVVPSPPPVAAVFPSPRWAGGMPEPPVIPTGAPFPMPVHHSPWVDRPMDDAPFIPHPPSDGSPPPVIVQPAHPRHSRTFAVPHSDGGSFSSGTPTQESFHQHPPVRPIPVPAPPGEHFAEPAFPVQPSPPLGHPPAPQNIINVGTPAPTPPVMPPPGQLQGPSSEPLVGYQPPMVGTVPVPASPRLGLPMSMPGATGGPPIVIQPPAQVAQPVLPSPLHSRGTPVSFHDPIMHSPRHSPLPSGQVFQPTYAYEGPVIERRSPPIEAFPDPVVVSVPTRRSYDSDYDYYYGRRHPHPYYYADDEYYYPGSRRHRRSRSPYYDDYYRRRHRRRYPRDDDSYDSEDDDRRDRDGRRLRRPPPETTTADPSQLGVQPMPYAPTVPTVTVGGVQPTREGEQPTGVSDEQGGAHPPRRQFELADEDRPLGRRDEPEEHRQRNEQEEPRRRRDDEEEAPRRRRSDEEEAPRRRRSDEEEEPRRRRSDEEFPDTGGPRRRPSDHTAYSGEPGDYERRPSILRTPRPDYGDGGPGAPHSYPPQSPVPPTIIRLGGEMDHGPPHVSPPPRSRRHYDRPASPMEYEHEIRRVPPGGTTIPHLPSEGGRSHRYPPSAAGSVAGIPHDIQDPHDMRDPHDRRDPHRMPSRGGPQMAEGTGRPPSEIAHRVPAPPTPEHILPGSEQTQLADDALRDQHERLDEAERELAQIVHDAHDSEMRREDEFRSNEEARQHTFLENEAQRDAETRQRGDALFRELEERVASVPPVPPIPPIPVPPPRDPEQASIIESIRTATQDAASRHAADILETVRMERELLEKEREQNAAERERERAELAAERQHINEEREARVRELEEELDRVRAELDSERQLRMTETEEARTAAAERDDALRNQLADIANMVQQNHACCEDNKAANEAQWTEKQQWKTERDNQIHELLGIVARIVEEQAAARQREEELRQADENKPSIEQVLEELRTQNNDQRDLLNALSETWRTDTQRQHDDLVNTVRATANEQVPYNVQGYLDEFSKALASEVRMLLGEVGKLREERRSIQHELGFLMMMKSKYGPGGEFDSEWQPPPPPPDAPVPPPEGPPPPVEPMHVRPGWRPVHQRAPTRRIRKPRQEAPLAPEPAPEPRHAQSWATWHPHPSLAPTPPSIEPTLVVPDRESPGLFGPRSPRGSYR